MSFLSQLFGKPDYREHILEAGIALANETERVYRNQLESVSITGRGLLKARLISATFSVAVYFFGTRIKNKQDAYDFSMACSGLAMRSLSRLGASPTISRDEAMTFADSFMSKILSLIQAELADGPSTLEHKTEAFRQIVETYHQCLAESAGQQYFQSQLRRELELPAESVIWTHFRFLSDMLQQVSK
jgi:hypothetical protein